MSGCPSLSNPYKMNANIVHGDHPLNNNNNILNFGTRQNNYLNSPPPKPSNNSSIRRTLSADMSSPSLLENNGFALKKTHSSEKLQALGEEVYDKDIQEIDDDNNKDKSGSGGAAFEDIWSSILSQKKLDGSGSGSGSGQPPSPYVHPLVKRSASSLSEKSLEICTESLGSETGSDGFSYPSNGDSDCKEDAEVEDAEIEIQQQEEHQQDITCNKVCHVEEVRGFLEVAKYNYPVNKKTGPPKSFPPPLPSLAHRNDGSNVHMRTERKDGRLVVEAVSVPSQNCFRAQRQDGRLLLIVTRDQELQQEDDMESEDEEEIKEVEEVAEGNVEELADAVEKKSSLVTDGGVINVQRSSTAMIMSKLIELTNTRSSLTWPRNFNKTVIKTLVDDEQVGARPPVAAHSLPPRPKMSTVTAAEAALNAYEYYWRSPTAATVAVLKPLAGKQNATKYATSPQVVKDNNNNNKNTNNNYNNSNNEILLAHNGKGGAQEVVLVKAAAVGGVAGEKREYLVPLLRGCKEPRRSLLFWEPYCIATS